MTPTPAPESNLTRPQPDEYAEYFGKYIKLVDPDVDVVEQIESEGRQTVALISALAPEKAAWRYADGKWSIAELMGHIIDTERIFAYRVLRIGRGDTTPLPGFDQDPYVRNGGFEHRTLGSLAEEFAAVRAATLSLLRTLPVEAWTRRGTSSDHPASARALVYVIAGHARHHMAILRERYLSGTAA